VGEGGIEVAGLEPGEAEMNELLTVDIEGWKQQVPQIHKHYAKFGDKLPVKLREQLQALQERLG